MSKRPWLDKGRSISVQRPLPYALPTCPVLRFVRVDPTVGDRKKSTATNVAARRRVVGYVRVSTNEQTLGSAAQRMALKKWCDRNGARLVRVFTDNGSSGAAALDKRPGLLNALDALKQLHAGVLLVAKRDRLARDTLVAATVERLAGGVGAVVCTADGVTEGVGPEALLLRRIMDAFAEYERQLIVARTRAAMALKKSRGERVSREPRYGWRLGRDGLHLEVHPAEQRTLSLVRRYRRNGLSLRQIARRLERCGLQPRSGGHWHPQIVARALARPL